MLLLIITKMSEPQAGYTSIVKLPTKCQVELASDQASTATVNQEITDYTTPGLGSYSDHYTDDV